MLKLTRHQKAAARYIAAHALGKPCACDNCDRIYNVDALKPARDLSARLDANGPTPAGECPACGALAYELEPATYATRQPARWIVSIDVTVTAASARQAEELAGEFLRTTTAHQEENRITAAGLREGYGGDTIRADD